MFLRSMKFRTSSALRCTIFVIGACATSFLAAAESSSVSLEEWREQFFQPSCESVEAEKALDFVAFNRHFPITKKFKYFAEEYRGPIFRIKPDVGDGLSPAYNEMLNVSLRFITDEARRALAYKDFGDAESFVWEDLRVYLDISDPSADFPPIYYALVSGSSGDGVILMISNSAEVVSKTVACSASTPSNHYP